ncbi:MAG: sporulation integral membrane protein YtvI [Gorillibacterium sp.]|nr:sporulation integral membrane protein YtvI [Gorillibacterium sp.]
MSGKNLILFLVGAVALYATFHYGAPFLVALLVAVLLDPLVRLGMKHNRISRRLSATLVCTVFTLLLILLMYGVGNKIVIETRDFAKTLNMDEIVTQVTDTSQGILDSISPELAQSVRDGLSSVLVSLGNILTGASGNVIISIPNFFLSSIVFLLGLFLISMGLPSIKASFLSLFEESTADKMDSVIQTIRKAINGFIIAQLLMSIITFVIMLAGLLILDVKYMLALAFIVTIVDILPILGTGSVLTPWAIYEIVTGNSYLGIGLLILYVVTLVVRRVLEPKVIGNAIGIGALPALISLFVGLKLIGLAGIFVGPLIVIIYKAMRSVGLLNIKIKIN